MKTNTRKEERAASMFNVIMLGIGSAFGLWALTALTFSLAKVNWQVGEMMRQYLVAVGVIGEFETLVDFYTHIKGIEYIICLAFLAAFPLFFKYMNTTKAQIKA